MKQVINIQRCLLGSVDHRVEVTRMQHGYGVRVFTNGLLNQEARVADRMEIGKAAQEMLRWEDKCGNISDLATTARKRLYEDTI